MIPAGAPNLVSYGGSLSSKGWQPFVRSFLYPWQRMPVLPSWCWRIQSLFADPALLRNIHMEPPDTCYTSLILVATTVQVPLLFLYCWKRRDRHYTWGCMKVINILWCSVAQSDRTSQIVSYLTSPMTLVYTARQNVDHFHASPSTVNYVYTVLGQKDSSDALFTPKVPIFTTLSHCTMSMRISENSSLH